MTHRLYYEDATLRTFSARVLERQMLKREDDNAHPAVRLDQTAFYPTSGGQPHDTGTLEGISVLDVLEDEAGEIWHVLAEPLSRTGDDPVIQGEINWTRRFDHMQQHTGQHILSAAFEEILGAKTIGFHLGSESSTIDLDLSELTWDEVSQVEETANAIVWQDRVVNVQIIDEADIHQVPLRKPPAVTGAIRVIWVEDYDASACGGTHVRRTGEIGLIKVMNLERYKGGTRVGFLCGGRALSDYRRTLAVAQRASAALSVGPEELVEAISRLEDDMKTTRKALGQVRRQMLAYEADELWQDAEIVNDVRFVHAHWPDRDFAEARELASELRERPGTLVVLSTSEGENVRFVCGRSDDLSQINASVVLRDVLGALDGRGGGSPALAQGGAAEQSADRVEDAQRRALAFLDDSIT